MKVSLCFRLQRESRSKRRGGISGGVSIMLLGLSLPPRAEGRLALGTRHHIWGSPAPAFVVERTPTPLPSSAEAALRIEAGWMVLHSWAERWEIKTLKMLHTLLQTSKSQQRGGVGGRTTPAQRAGPAPRRPVHRQCPQPHDHPDLPCPFFPKSQQNPHLGEHIPWPFGVSVQPQGRKT